MQLRKQIVKSSKVLNLNTLAYENACQGCQLRTDSVRISIFSISYRIILDRGTNCYLT